jgi:catechol 2,3-dioxygenase-like lactoylglutathione lyase family enzyme
MECLPQRRGATAAAGCRQFGLEVNTVILVKKLHHNAYRCRDSEQTREFYEDFLGLPLSYALRIDNTASGRATRALHTFYQMDDRSYLAFFEVPGDPFEFKRQNDFDLHIALEVERTNLDAMLAKARAAGMEVRGIADHDIVESIYLRDPNGYVIELAARAPETPAIAAALSRARDSLNSWQMEKMSAAS